MECCNWQEVISIVVPCAITKKYVLMLFFNEVESVIKKIKGCRNLNTFLINDGSKDGR